MFFVAFSHKTSHVARKCPIAIAKILVYCITIGYYSSEVFMLSCIFGEKALFDAAMLIVFKQNVSAEEKYVIEEIMAVLFFNTIYQNFRQEGLRVVFKVHKSMSIRL